MKDLLVFIPIALAFLILKGALLPNTPLPDLPLLIVFYLASARPTVEGVVIAFVVGYVDDMLSGGLVGAGAFSLVVTFAVVYVASRRISFSNAPAKVFFTAIAAIVNAVSAYLVWRLVNPDVALLSGGVFVTAALSAAFAPAAISLFARISRPRAAGLP